MMLVIKYITYQINDKNEYMREYFYTLSIKVYDELIVSEGFKNVMKLVERWEAEKLAKIQKNRESLINYNT